MASFVTDFGGPYDGWGRAAGAIVGGLRGGAGRGPLAIFSLCLAPSARTVDADDEDVEDSRTEESARSSGVLCLVMGGLDCNGLACLVRTVDLVDKATPGEYEDIDVGVDETLKGPGDSEYRVEGVVERAY